MHNYLILWVPGGFPVEIPMGTRCFTFKDHKSHYFDRAWQHYYSPVDWPGELFKPSDSASLLVQIDFFSFWVWVFFGWCHNGDMFSPLWPSLLGGGHQPNGLFFWLKFFFRILAVIQVFRGEVTNMWPAKHSGETSSLELFMAFVCLFLLMNFFIFNRFHSMSKKLCGPLTQR